MILAAVLGVVVLVVVAMATSPASIARVKGCYGIGTLRCWHCGESCTIGRTYCEPCVAGGLGDRRINPEFEKMFS